MRALVAGAVLLCASGGTALAADATCTLTPADKTANRLLTFQQFDQDGITPATWRRLQEAGCGAQALDAVDDYLANGPPQTPNHKSIILFHEAQTLGLMGREAEAARMVAAAIPPDRVAGGDPDWTTYLIGTWAFFTKDRAGLEQAEAAMAAEPGDGNRLDTNVLRGLLTCFDKPYAQADLLTCRPHAP